eukprot:6438856-Amphidinium_carterae.1
MPSEVRLESEKGCPCSWQISPADHLFTHWESRTKQAAARRRWSNSAVALIQRRLATKTLAHQPQPAP